MTGYRQLLRTPEFTPLLLSSAAHTTAQTVAGLALGTLVHRATGSPLLSAVSMFGPSLAQVLGATLLLSGADRLPRGPPWPVSPSPSPPSRPSSPSPACRSRPSSRSSSRRA